MSRACVYCRPPAKRRTSGRLQPPCGCWVELALVVRYSQSHLPFWYSNPLLRYSQPPNRYSHLPIKYSYSLPRYSHLPIRCCSFSEVTALDYKTEKSSQSSTGTCRDFWWMVSPSDPFLSLLHMSLLKSDDHQIVCIFSWNSSTGAMKNVECRYMRQT